MHLSIHTAMTFLNTSRRYPSIRTRAKPSQEVFSKRVLPLLLLFDLHQKAFGFAQLLSVYSTTNSCSSHSLLYSPRCKTLNRVTCLSFEALFLWPSFLGWNCFKLVIFYPIRQETVIPQKYLPALAWIGWPSRLPAYYHSSVKGEEKIKWKKSHRLIEWQGDNLPLTTTDKTDSVWR